jgi:effector-binding domain-containing protein
MSVLNGHLQGGYQMLKEVLQFVGMNKRFEISKGFNTLPLENHKSVPYNISIPTSEKNEHEAAIFTQHNVPTHKKVACENCSHQ